MEKKQPMTYLFVFAHPDDETVACGGTVARLVEQGDTVHIVLATAGDAGEVSRTQRKRVADVGSLAQVRKEEVTRAVQELGAEAPHILTFIDGTLTNADAWGALKEAILQHIEAIQPDFLVTFDHTGWYYHLDHIAVSIAATLAFHEASHRAQGMLYSHYRPWKSVPNKWRYAYQELQAVTHGVHVTNVEKKIAALQQHKTQDLSTPLSHTKQSPHYELFQAAFLSKEGEAYVGKSPVFEPISILEGQVTRL